MRWVRTAHTKAGFWGISKPQAMCWHMVPAARQQAVLQARLPRNAGDHPSSLYGKYTWRVPNFSDTSRRELRSRSFTVGDYSFYILVYPNGCDVCNHLSLFLCVADYDKLLPGAPLHPQPAAPPAAPPPPSFHPRCSFIRSISFALQRLRVNA